MMCTVVDGWWCYSRGVRMTVSGGVGGWTWCNQWCYQTGEVGMNW